MTFDELEAYLDENALTVEVYGPIRQKQMRLAPPPWMTKGECIDHAAKIGVHLKAHRDSLYRKFSEMTTGWHGVSVRLHPRAERIANTAEAFRLWNATREFTGNRLAAYCEYTAATRYVDSPGGVKPWDTLLYFEGGMEFFLPHSSPPPRWKCPGKHWIPPYDWNNTIGWKPPEETEAERKAKRIAALAKRFPEVFGAKQPEPKPDWID